MPVSVSKMEREEYCIGCKKSSEEIKLLDALKDGRSVKICEACTLIENVLVLRKPTASQLNQPNKPSSVYNRLRRLAGLDREDKGKGQKQDKKLDVYSLMDKKYKMDLSEYSIKKRQEIIEKLRRPVNLIEHFDWIIQKERRKRGLSLRQLADVLGENETVLKMFESANLPDDARRIAEKIEQFFQIKIIKSPEEAEKEEEQKRIKAASRILKFDPESLKNLTIADLREMRKRREISGQNAPDTIDADKIENIDEIKSETNKDFKGEVEFIE